MTQRRRWPQAGDTLTHRFRDRRQIVVAIVKETDQATGKIIVQVGDETFPSLSAAAKAIQGTEANGWFFWGSKKVN